MYARAQGVVPLLVIFFSIEQMKAQAWGMINGIFPP